MPLWKKLKVEGKKVDGGMTKVVRTFASVRTIDTLCLKGKS